MLLGDDRASQQHAHQEEAPVLRGQERREQERHHREVVIAEDGQQAVTGDEEEGDSRHPPRDTWKERAQQEPDRHGADQEKDTLVPPAEDQPRQRLQREGKEELDRPGDQVMQGRAGEALPPGCGRQPGASVVGTVGVLALEHEAAGKLRLVRAITDQGVRGCDQVPAEDGPDHRQGVEHGHHRRDGECFRPRPGQRGHDQGRHEAGAGGGDQRGQRPGDRDLPVDRDCGQREQDQRERVTVLGHERG
ncbi:MAG: hypothetical protein E6I47_01880 [Chloroflexi bacterium]|nr:MAG: hypothetical protein E6I47_01880 [Chloroflexota bacterium]